MKLGEPIFWKNPNTRYVSKNYTLMQSHAQKSTCLFFAKSILHFFVSVFGFLVRNRSQLKFAATRSKKQVTVPITSKRVQFLTSSVNWFVLQEYFCNEFGVNDGISCANKKSKHTQQFKANHTLPQGGKAKFKRYFLTCKAPASTKLQRRRAKITSKITCSFRGSYT